MSAGTPETWLLDLGNSRAKVARLEAGAPADAFALEWGAPGFAADLQARLARWPRPARVWVASVASLAHAQAVRAVLATFAPARAEWLRTPRCAGGVTNRYARPERLGIDRFLAMLAAHARARGACIIVGCGTALTLDAVGAGGDHVEGLITLAPDGMLRALQGATAIADGNPDAFAAGARDDTALALHAGCWASAGALVEWFVARQQAGGAGRQAWLHGGWAARLAAWLARDGCQVQVLDNAVLRGLAAWAGAANVESSADLR
ncbi:MAG: type III pantothenate kinase [Rhodanobacteraceae bacterium]|nr:MAG: type III pantothenate kinase [Rhodanobacteraceae bacterium]